MGSVVMLIVLAYLKCVIICIASSYWFPLEQYRANEITLDSAKLLHKCNVALGSSEKDHPVFGTGFENNLSHAV